MAGTAAEAAALALSSRSPAGSKAETHSPESRGAPSTCRTTCCTTSRLGVSAVKGCVASVRQSASPARTDSQRAAAAAGWAERGAASVAVGNREQTPTATPTTISEGRTAPMRPEMGRSTCSNQEHSSSPCSAGSSAPTVWATPASAGQLARQSAVASSSAAPLQPMKRAGR
eukprot:scaffold13162_cov82-Isochrysis_galbana.AAC.4